MWSTEQKSCKNTWNNSCRCGQGSKVTAAHGEAASWDRAFIHGCFLILVLFSYWQYGCQCKQSSTSQYSFRARPQVELGYTKRCPRLCCLACSYLSTRAQGCPTFFIYSLPSRWPNSDIAKKEKSLPHNSLPSSLLCLTVLEGWRYLCCIQ